MTADSTKLVVPGHGTIFHAPVGTKPPANPVGAAGFNIQTDGPTVWKNLGHTSKSNTIAFTKEGGDKETLDTFLADAVRTSTSAVTWGLTVAALQMDAETLDLAFNGDIDPATGGYTVATPSPLKTALFIYFQDDSGSLGFWVPNTEVSLGDAPSVDTAAFFELPLSATFLAAASTDIPAVNGRAGVFQIFHPGIA